MVGEEHGVKAGGESEVHGQTFPRQWFRKELMSSHCKPKKVCCRPSFDTTHVGDSRLGPSLVDGDWHAICQAIFQGVGKSEWELSEIWRTHEGQGAVVFERSKKTNGHDVHGLGSVQKIQEAVVVGQALVTFCQVFSAEC